MRPNVSEASFRSRPPPVSTHAFGWSRDSEPDGDREMLFGAAMHELQNIGILATVTGSTLNDLYHTGADVLPAHCNTLVPPDPITLPMLANTTRILRLSPQLTAYIEAVIYYLDSAKALMRSKLSPGGESAAISNVEFDELVDAWRATNGAIFLAFEAIERGPPVRLEIETRTSITKLKELLVRARDGGTPCLANGKVEFPHWAQRRQRQRVLLNVRAVGRYHGRLHTILVRDASFGGLGIDCAPNLTIGDSVIVTMEDGRRFETSVAWCNGPRAGLQFSTELMADDPLIAQR